MIPRPLPIPEDAEWRPGPGGVEVAAFFDTHGVAWAGARAAGAPAASRLLTAAEWESVVDTGEAVPLALSTKGFDRLCRTWRNGPDERRAVSPERLDASVRTVSAELFDEGDHTSIFIANCLLYEAGGSLGGVAERLRERAAAGHDYLTPLRASGVTYRFGQFRNRTIGAYRSTVTPDELHRLSVSSSGARVERRFDTTVSHRRKQLRNMTTAELLGLPPGEAVDGAVLGEVLRQAISRPRPDSQRQAVTMYYTPLLILYDAAGQAQPPTGETPLVSHPSQQEISTVVELSPGAVSKVLRDARTELMKNYQRLTNRPGPTRPSR